MIEYRCQPQTDEMTLSGLLQRAQTAGGGPYPAMGQRAVVVQQENQAVVTFNDARTSAAAFPLITCAGIVMASGDPNAPLRGVVRHAGAGGINQQQIQQMNALIGNPPAQSLQVVFAVTRRWDADYQAAAQQFHQFGVLPNFLVYIQMFPMNNFGLGSNHNVGWAAIGEPEEQPG